MKIAYQKPMVEIERYELSQAITACDNKIGFTNSACVLKDPDATAKAKDLAAIGWFMEDFCVLWSVGEDGNDGICYHSNANAMFSS